MLMAVKNQYELKADSSAFAAECGLFRLLEG